MENKFDIPNVEQLMLYQSANTSPELIKKNFVIRLEEYEDIVAAMQNKDWDDPLQHELILGRRGSGKSTLLKRIEIEVNENPDLKKKFIAVNLAEEQAGIYRLFDLFEQVLIALGFDMDNVEYDSDSWDNDQYARSLYQKIHAYCAENKKRIVLLLDNFDVILDNMKDDGHLLREILINYKDIQLIVGSTRMDEHFWSYDKPFYEFFRKHRLEALSREEMARLINHWADSMGIEELKEFSVKHAGKFENIRILTDGLPRTIQFFIQMVLQRKETDSYTYLQKIMDLVTPLYQERLKYLTPPLRKTVYELAFFWEAVTTKELVQKLKMESKLVSANLKTLIQNGIVEKIETDTKNHLYRISERFFNLWIIITQGNPLEKKKAKWLSIFLENWYSKDEIHSLAQRHFSYLKECKEMHVNDLFLTKALAQSRYISTKERDNLIELSEGKVSENELSYLSLPRKYKEIAKEIEGLIKSKKYDNALEILKDIENEEDGVKFLGIGYIYELKADYKQSEMNYQLSINKGNVKAALNLANLYQEFGAAEQAENCYLQAIDEGSEDALYNLANLYLNKGKLDLAEAYYLKAIKRGISEALNNIGIVYEKLGKPSLAENYYLKAIEKGQLHAYNNLAYLYYSLNQNPKESLNYINHTTNHELKIIIKVWNGIFNNLYGKVTSMIKKNGILNLEGFLIHLLTHQQKNLILSLFENSEIGKELQDKYQVLYYAVLLLTKGKEDKNIERRIPPEFKETIENILNEVKELEKYYGYV